MKQYQIQLKLQSDCATLSEMIYSASSRFGDKIHYIRDLTRGGLGSALNEISDSISKKVEVELDQLPIQYEVKMASDMLGVNPIYLANEGSLVVFSDPSISNELVSCFKANKYGKNSRIVGKVMSGKGSGVVGVNIQGDRQLIEHLYGQELPRLC